MRKSHKEPARRVQKTNGEGGREGKVNDDAEVTGKCNKKEKEKEKRNACTR